MEEAFNCIACGGRRFYRQPGTNEFNMEEILSASFVTSDISFPIYGLLLTEHGFIRAAHYENGEWHTF